MMGPAGSHSYLGSDTRRIFQEVVIAVIPLVSLGVRGTDTPQQTQD
jgi:hypothetical protein